jgi:hypothetical protein
VTELSELVMSGKPRSHREIPFANASCSAGQLFGNIAQLGRDETREEKGHRKRESRTDPKCTERIARASIGLR